MIKHALSSVAAIAVIAIATSGKSEAGSPYNYTHQWAQQAAGTYPWHGGYYNQQYGSPIALVAPPTAHMRQTYSWGVSQNLMYPIHHQFGPRNPGYGYAGSAGFSATPHWPSHTDQFGVYYVRGPW